MIAYGEVQIDSLQLHRPEVCYTAVGFEISATERTDIALAPGVLLPARQLVARNDQQVESILYWTRIGDDLPTSGSEQRYVKLGQQMAGYIADGILVRVSTPQEASPQVYEQLCEFSRELISNISKPDLPALLGRPLAAAIA